MCSDETETSFEHGSWSCYKIGDAQFAENANRGLRDSPVYGEMGIGWLKARMGLLVFF